MTNYVLKPTRLIDKEEAEELDLDAYVLIDSATEGMKCIKVRNLIFGGQEDE